MAQASSRNAARQKRHARVRLTVRGTAERPRLAVYRSLQQIYAQVIDDLAGHTLVAASTVDHEIRAKLNGLTKTDQAKEVGKLVAVRAKDKGVTKVVFDRGGYQYIGRVKALADAAREAGLDF